MERVGARELKDRLAYYLRTVRQGETVVVTIVLATFDRELWQAAGLAGLQAWPE